jgi:dienelactone hydrolase
MSRFSDDLFGDLLLIRKGGVGLTLGEGPSVIGPITTREEWDVKAEALRDIFRLTLGDVRGVEGPLSIEVEYEKDRGDHFERRISYLVEPDERVASLLLVPKNVPLPAPATLCIHSTQALGKEETVGRGGPAGNAPPKNRACALDLVRRGCIAFAPDLLGSGERISPGRKAFDNGPLYEKHPRWSGTGKDLWDMRRALDVMTRMREIDGARMGAMGHSQGGGITVYLMAVDERIRVGVSNCGFWPLRFSKNPFALARTGWWIGRPALRPFCWAGKPMPIDFHELLALVAPRPFLNIIALNDWQYTLEEEAFTRRVWENLAANVERVYTLLGAAHGFHNVLHTGGHDFPQDMREAACDFLYRELERFR